MGEEKNVVSVLKPPKNKKRGEVQGQPRSSSAGGTGQSKGAAPVQGMLQGAAWLPAKVFSPSSFQSTTLHPERKRGKAGRREGVSGIEQQCGAISLGS